MHSSAGQRPAHHTQAAHRQPEDQAVIGQSGSGHSPEKQAAAPGKESSMSSWKAGMVALNKGMGIGTTDVKGTKLEQG